MNNETLKFPSCYLHVHISSGALLRYVARHSESLAGGLCYLLPKQNKKYGPRILPGIKVPRLMNLDMLNIRAKK